MFDLSDPNIGRLPDRRHTVNVTLGGAGGKEGGGPFVASIQLSPGESLPDLLHYDDRIYIKRGDSHYAIARAFPLVQGVDVVRKLDDGTGVTAED